MRSLAVSTALALSTAGAAQVHGWDVPVRGGILFERAVDRFAVSPPSTARIEPLLPSGKDGGWEWRRFACAAGREPPGFEQEGFDDTGWLTGSSAFGTDEATRPEQRTHWDQRLLLLRTTLDVGRSKPKALIVRADHDDALQVWLNGQQVVDAPLFGLGKVYVVTGDALKALRVGRNLLAVRCENTGGAQQLDLGVDAMARLPGGAKGNREAVAQLWTDADTVRRELCTGLRPPAMLLHGELDPGRDRPELPPVDLRELPFWIACDLFKQGAGGSYTRSLHRIYRLGDLEVHGRFAPQEPGGWQDLEVDIETAKDLDALGDSKRYLQQHVMPHVTYAFRGTVRARRRLVPHDNGLRVEECRCTLTGTVSGGKDRKEPMAELQLEEHYRIGQVRDGQDTAFRQEVRASIDRGVAFLRQDLNAADPPDYRGAIAGEGLGRRTYGSGRLALSLLALLRGGTAADDPLVQRWRRELSARELVDSYSLGNALMVLEACHAPANEITDLMTGQLERSSHREVDNADRQVMRGWLQRLLDNIDTRPDPTQILRFNYVRDGRFDQSVNQYGLLGLYSAHLCDLPISPIVWTAAANHLLSSQCEPGAPVRLWLTDFRQLLQQQGATTATASPVAPAGWNYQEPREQGEDRPSWGSMTCAGLTGLAICEAALRDQQADDQARNRDRDRLLEQIAAARAAGFAWLARNLTVRYHPGTIQMQRNHYYYYLYGLERAALLSGVAWIQGRDWYFEGAMVLVHSQMPNGSWPGDMHGENDVERTAMAVLFLAKSSPPVLTGR